MLYVKDNFCVIDKYLKNDENSNISVSIITWLVRVSSFTYFFNL